VLHFTIEWGLTTAELIEQKPVKLRTLGEDYISLKIKKKKPIIVENAKIIKPDIIAENGIIHIIDNVFFPPDLIGIV
ncbi:MAG: fasciclin domain-containing protein, partial [Promethearchaeota archaeon]